MARRYSNEELSVYGYGCEKVGLAVLELCTGRGRIIERLTHVGNLYLGAPDERHFPEHLRAEFLAIQEELSPGQRPKLTEDRSVELAARLLEVRDKMDEVMRRN